MSSGTPIVRQVSWLAVVPQLAAMSGAMFVAYLVGAPDPMVCGAAGYLIYSFGSRRLLTRSHRAGIRLVKRGQFAEASKRFQESLQFFERYPWIDRFRSFVLMSPSAVSYQEMALANIAFCYGQLGNGEQSRTYYKKCLERFPESGLATAALRMLDSVSTPAAS